MKIRQRITVGACSSIRKMKFMVAVLELVAILVVCTACTVESRKLRPDCPKVEFFNYSGEDAIVSCTDQPSKKLETGETMSVPYTHSSQACSVTLKNGYYVSFVVSQVLPGSSNSGLSVSVDIDETYLYLTVNDTDEHAFVNASDHDHAEAEEQTLATWNILSDL